MSFRNSRFRKWFEKLWKDDLEPIVEHVCAVLLCLLLVAGLNWLTTRLLGSPRDQVLHSIELVFFATLICMFSCYTLALVGVRCWARIKFTLQTPYSPGPDADEPDDRSDHHTSRKPTDLIPSRGTPSLGQKDDSTVQPSENEPRDNGSKTPVPVLPTGEKSDDEEKQ